MTIAPYGLGVSFMRKSPHLLEHTVSGAYTPIVQLYISDLLASVSVEFSAIIIVDPSKSFCFVSLLPTSDWLGAVTAPAVPVYVLFQYGAVSWRYALT